MHLYGKSPFISIVSLGLISLAYSNPAACRSHSSAETECLASDTPLPITDDFFAWIPSRANHLLEPLFPNISLLKNAWEVHPLLSKISFSGDIRSSSERGRIPTIFHNASTLDYSWISLLSVDDIPTILSQTNNGNHLVHGSDYKLVKKIILPETHSNAGEEYMGMLPKQHYTLPEIEVYFHYKGFSLVIDKMQLKSRRVANKAREVEEALGVQHVGTNLYLTPEAERDEVGEVEKQVRQGFEAHWDWMDVIVIQLSGRKRWSVAKEPTVYLSNKDQKRKPSKVEAQHFAHKGQYEEFTLCPGDVLYIPRGFIHNASTVDFEEMQLSNSFNELWDGCPDYPTASEEMLRVAQRLPGPSLHLTFGLEHSCEGTIEALLHHSLHVFYASTPHKTMQVIPDCDATWKSILHYSLGEVARRKHDCDNPSYYGLSKNDVCDGTAILRRSVPLIEQTDEADEMQQLSHLKDLYQKALDLFLNLADMKGALDFLQSHVMQPSDASLQFCFPGYSTQDVITASCVEELLSSVQAKQSDYLEVVKSFVSFGSANFDIAMKRMNEHGNQELQKRRRAKQKSM